MKEMIYKSEMDRELLANGEYKGYNFYIYSLGTHPTAYVEIPNKSKLYNKSYEEMESIEVHGGITFIDNELCGIPKVSFFIGWDYAHYRDYFGMGIFDGKKWTTNEIYEEVKNVINQIIEIGEK